MNERREWLRLLVRRDICGYEIDPVKPATFHRSLCQSQVSTMHGIKRSSEQSDIHNSSATILYRRSSVQIMDPLWQAG